MDVKSVIIFCSLLVLATSQKDVNLCRTQKTCGECIAASPNCAWCSQEKFHEDNPSCDLYENLMNKGCAKSEISNPDHHLNYTQDKKVTDGSRQKEAIQIQPQNITLKIRPNKPTTINLKFRLAENYPVDLYYLMDLSASMADDKKKLATLGEQIAKKMVEITEDFRLGFGSFVDKVTMPYVSTIKSELESPCNGCVPPYSFKHQLTLNNDPKKFERKVLEAAISGNLDSPESGFDAIIQAIACSRIGWRKKSRRMLLFSTDASSHFAGDGKLGGIVKPNDGECHLNKEGYYSKGLEQDYPSISQIAAKVSEKKVNVIFAVTSQQLDLYRRLSKYVEGSTIGNLQNDSSNIVRLVADNYDKITSKVEMSVKYAEGIKVTLKSRCLDKDGEMVETNTCDKLKIGQQVNFDVEIEVTECPKDRSQWTRDIEISAVGLNDALGIRLELMCECDCQKPENQYKGPDRCTGGRGVYACGICDCQERYTGQFCQCDVTDDVGDAFEKQCINSKAGSTQVCTGRGTCHCGICQCNSMKTNDGRLVYYDGRYCECDNYGCSYHTNGLMCAGPDHGKCRCGKCKCKPGWSGESCGCTTNNSTCIARNGVMCNGYGECRCGTCDCYKNDRKYSGASCEECATCGGGVHCRDSEPCVQCRVFKTGKYDKDECDALCPHMEVVPYSLLDNTTSGEELCYLTDEDECKGHFKYSYLTNGTLLFTVSTLKQCPEPVNVLAIVLGVVGGIVLLGLLILLIWKIVTMIQDRREYAKFEETNKNRKWDTEENPIYKQATTTFKNPTYQAKG